MQIKKSYKKLSFILTVITDVVLFFAVFFLMRHVQNLLYSDVQINLTEIVTQNKNVISSRLTLEMNNMELVARQISDQYYESGVEGVDNLKTIYLNFIKEKKVEELFMATEDGKGVFSDGNEIDISGRQYFRRAMEGKQNISEQMISRLNGDDIFVISIPLECQDKIIGTIQKWYSPEQMYELCAVSLFSENGYMNIINSDGYILISSDRVEHNAESDNYFRYLYTSSPEKARCLEADIAEGKSGFMENERDGKKYFSAYTQVEDVYDWYLISSVATDAVSPNANIVIRMFYFILIVMVLIFTITLFYLLILKNGQETKLRRIAFIDKVTGGDAYAKFVYDLEIILQEKDDSPLYMFAFDIDNFKYINSYYGFQTGDRILKDIYQQYKRQLAADEHIARVHGDHFIMLLRQASNERLEKLFQAELSYQEITIYLSGGLYTVTDRSESISLMLDKANTAKQKSKGIRYKRIEIYSEDLGNQIMHSEQMKRLVEQALADGDMIPYFQPKVDINNRKLVGAEALARWKKKDGSLVPPGEFIPICEKTGMIVLLDMAIFEKTLKFLRKNLDLGVQCVPVSVNFSRTHFLNRDFLDIIMKKITEYQIPPELIEIEITETAIFDNYQEIESFIEKLHAQGLKISMDDFGSGYSSLHMIKDIDIDVMKIDRGFLMETTNSLKQRTVFAAIAQMAQGLDISVVVEGVENMENVEMMQEFGCSIAQGFYFARPMPQEEFEELCKKGYICEKES